MNNKKNTTGPLVATGTLMGIGMGGFVDGILFHQLLQLHSMLSAKLPQDVLLNVKVSMFWDGLFHALTWTATAISIGMLWHMAKRDDVVKSGKIFRGALLLGCGIFNVVEGMIDHFILGVHHVVERLGLSLYDYLFVAAGLVMIVVGLVLIRTGERNLVQLPG